MTRDQVFSSRYVKASDLPEPRALTISGTVMELFQNDGREQEKLVISFKERDVKALITNMTNFDTIAAVAGTDETSRWVCRPQSRQIRCYGSFSPISREKSILGSPF
jgi:hypothetical protein